MRWSKTLSDVKGLSLLYAYELGSPWIVLICSFSILNGFILSYSRSFICSLISGADAGLTLGVDLWTEVDGGEVMRLTYLSFIYSFSAPVPSIDSYSNMEQLNTLMDEMHIVDV